MEIYIQVSVSTYKNVSIKDVGVKAFNSEKECKAAFDRNHKHDKNFCVYCNTEWVGSYKKYTDDDVKYELKCHKVTVA